MVLDLLSYDSSSPFGVPALWPTANQYNISPISVFLDIQRDQVSTTFVRSLFRFHNFLPMLIGIVFFQPLSIIVSIFKRNSARIVGRAFQEE